MWTPNYAPELIGISPLVTDACEWFAQAGHSVDVVTALPNYPERRIHQSYRGKIWHTEYRRGVAMHRSWLRVRPNETFLDKTLYEATFAAFSLPQVLRRFGSADVLVCLVPSLLAASLAARIPRRPRLVLWWQDLVIPAALSIGGISRAERRALAAARRLECMAARRADRIVTCSPGFVNHLEALGIETSRIGVIPNWADTDWIVPEASSAREHTRFLYAGNLGYTQDFETLFKAVQDLPLEVELLVVGAGNAIERIRTLAGSTPRAVFRPLVPHDRYPALLAAADVHVVLQRRVSAGANLPSKIASYLASGRPIVASVHQSSPAGQLLRKSGGAIIVPPDDPQALGGAMRQLHNDAGLRAELGRRGREFAVAALSRKVILPLLEREVLDH